MLGLAVRVAWVRGVVRVGVWVYVPHRKTSGRTLVSPSGYLPAPRSSTALGHAWARVRVRSRVRSRSRSRGRGRGRGRLGIVRRREATRDPARCV